MLKSLVSILALILSISVCGHAFDLNGFKDGMTKKEVKELIFKKDIGRISDQGNVLLAESKGPNKRNLGWYYFDFCDEKLVQVRTPLPLELDAFYRKTLELTREYGQPNVKVIVKFKSIKEIYFVWHRGSDEMYIQILDTGEHFDNVDKVDWLNYVTVVQNVCSEREKYIK
ncbi:MAG: hypothetical protein ACHP6H_04075 [Legionellales bacterium]